MTGTFRTSHGRKPERDLGMKLPPKCECAWSVFQRIVSEAWWENWGLCGNLEFGDFGLFLLTTMIFESYQWRRQWHPTLVLLPGKSHGQRSLVGCSPWGHKESDMTEQLPFHFSLSRTGEGNGNPLQCSCLENPRDGGAWWAAIYGVTQSRTRLKRLSSSSSSSMNFLKYVFSQRMELSVGLINYIGR